MTRQVKIGSFLARTDSGKEYTIIEYQEAVSAPSFDAPTGKVAGLCTYLTSTGLDVSQIDAKTFKVIQTNELVRKV